MNYYHLLKKNPELFDNEGALLKVITRREDIRLWEKNKKAELKKNKEHIDWGKIGVLVDDPYNIVLRDLVEFPDGKRRGYIRSIARANLFGGRGVVVLPIFKNKICLIHIYRHPTRSWHLEFPRGYGELGIPSIENAKKEIKEEIDGEILEISHLGEIFSNTGYESQGVDAFFVKLINFGDGDENEGINQIELFTKREFEEHVSQGYITDGFTLSTYALAISKGYFKN